DEDVEAVMLGEDLVGEPADLRQRGEVGQVERQAVVAGGLADLAPDRLAPRGGAPVHEDGGAGRGQLARERFAEAIGGAGDENDLPLERSHARPPTGWLQAAGLRPAPPSTFSRFPLRSGSSIESRSYCRDNRCGGR